MHIFLGLRCKNILEEDIRVSKFNYGSRKGYSIDNTILEKYLICDISIWTILPTVYVLTDLKACYNRQLVSIESIVLELIRADRKALIVFAKVLPAFQHFICTGYGINKDSYGSIEDLYRGTTLLVNYIK